MSYKNIIEGKLNGNLHPSLSHDDKSGGGHESNVFLPSASRESRDSLSRYMLSRKTVSRDLTDVCSCS